MKPSLCLLLIAMIFPMLTPTLSAQKCRSHANWEEKVEQDPQALLRREQLQNFTEIYQDNSSSRALKVTIPVVVHVLYNNSTQNISTAQINSQIDRLNEDFRLMNADSLSSSHAFWPYVADAEIEFCLAQQDPDGFATTGITRTQTSVPYFDGYSEDMKSSATGGVDNWDPTSYLNMWVVGFHNDSLTLGFAAFPSELSSDPELDGIVFRHEVFGTVGTAGSNGFGVNDNGRTATHEVGHWLNLFHIWGDDICGDDLVNDTPEHEEENYDCPSFPNRPNNSCGSDQNGEMYMNYMDYVDDDCMKMFTGGQKLRMHAAIDGARSALKTSAGCESSSVGIRATESIPFNLYPNPADDMVMVDFGASQQNISASVYSLSGTLQMRINQKTGSSIQLPVNALTSGCYLVEIASDQGVKTVKLFVR